MLAPIQSGLSEPLSATNAIFVLTQGISTQLKQWETNSAKVFERLTRLCHSLESLLEENIVSMGQAWSKLSLKSFLQLLSLALDCASQGVECVIVAVRCCQCTWPGCYKVR